MFSSTLQKRAQGCENGHYVDGRHKRANHKLRAFIECPPLEPDMTDPPQVSTTDAATVTHSTDSVEALIRYASHRFAAADVPFRPKRMSKLIRNAIHRGCPARRAIDSFLNDYLPRQQALNGTPDMIWSGFELHVNGYRDPVGALAVQRIDPRARWQTDPYWQPA
jgi:hypothetical protein